MMSPLSIATFLPPGSLSFDLVVFDEASQVRPIDALGALLRGRQAVVVGDSRQLPPTTFFDRILESDEDVVDLDSELAPDNELIGQNESVLDLFLAQGAPQRMLRWHYRSRHESLIAISNRHFYDNQLILFPSPDAGRKSVGLYYHHLPHTIYDRGGTRTNQLEAEAVAKAVVAHAIERPGLTLGVATFSSVQRSAVEQAVDNLRQADPSVEPFFQRHPHEPFFVKNLENVQGDERDVMLISLGYGRDAAGKVSMNFGPLNVTGGERRLNVLITRARRRCELYTNLQADDIDLRRSDARGVAALKAYLSYAATGELGASAPDQTDNPAGFATVVAAELNEMGYHLQERVGQGGVEIDVAVGAAEDPNQFLLGLEFDGHDYFRAKSARDRDRIQQEVLTSLGWQIQRIWSTEWLRDPAGQRQRLKTIIDRIYNGERINQQESAAEPPQPVTRYAPQAPQLRELPPYTRANLGLGDETHSFSSVAVAQAGRWLHKIVAVESPVHFEDALRQLSLEMGLQRLSVGTNGWYSKQFLKEAIKVGQNEGIPIQLTSHFLWRLDMKTPPPRSRKELPAASRNFEYICSAEIREAIRLVVHDAFVISLRDVVKQVMQLFGFGRLGKHNRQRIVSEAGAMLRHRELHLFNGQLATARFAAAEAVTKEAIMAVMREAMKRTSRRKGDPLELDITFPEYQRVPATMSLFRYPNWRNTATKAHFFSTPLYVYDCGTDSFTAEHTLPFRNRGFNDFPLGLEELEESMLFSRLHYQAESGHFTHESAFVCVADARRLGIPIRTMYRLWRDPESGRFYGIRHPEKRQKSQWNYFGQLEFNVEFDPKSGILTDIAPFKGTPNTPKRLTQVSESISADVKHEHVSTIRRIIGEEGPLHLDELKRIVAQAAGYQRPTALINSILAQLLTYAIDREVFDKDGDFVYVPQLPIPGPRDRSSLPNPSRKLDYIPNAEVDAALIAYFDSEPDYPMDKLDEAMAQLFGVRRLSGHQKARLKERVSGLVAAGRVTIELT